MTDLEKRFERVAKFIEYLENEENREFEMYGLKSIDSPITEKLVPNMKQSFSQQQNYINKKRTA